MNKIKQSIFYKHREFLTLPFAWLLWYVLNGYFAEHHPNIALHDSGVFEAVFLGTVCLFTGMALIWFTLRVFLGELYKELDQFAYYFQNKFTPWEKSLYSLVFFCVLLIVWAMLVRAFI